MERHSHLLVVLLEVNQLLLQALDLNLQVGASDGEIVQDLPQPADVSLHGLPHEKLVVVPA